MVCLTQAVRPAKYWIRGPEGHIASATQLEVDRFHSRSRNRKQLTGFLHLAQGKLGPEREGACFRLHSKQMNQDCGQSPDYSQSLVTIKI